MRTLHIQAFNREHIGRTLQFFGKEKQRRRLFHLVGPPRHHRRQPLQFVQVDASPASKNIQVRSARPEISARRGTVQDHRLQILAAASFSRLTSSVELRFHHGHLPALRISRYQPPPAPPPPLVLRQILRIRRHLRPSLLRRATAPPAAASTPSSAHHRPDPPAAAHSSATPIDIASRTAGPRPKKNSRIIPKESKHPQPPESSCFWRTCRNCGMPVSVTPLSSAIYFANCHAPR